jgi:hypothetical protein
MNLTPHFTLEELTFSQTAVRLGLSNAPDDEVLANLNLLAAALEDVRGVLNGDPMIISSGYRSEAVNRAVGGVANSAHRDGLAADFICPQFGAPLRICETLAHAHNLDFDQVIQEGTWVHYAIAAPGKTGRRQLLTAHFTGGGAASYTTGLA